MILEYTASFPVGIILPLYIFPPLHSPQYHLGSFPKTIALARAVQKPHGIFLSKLPRKRKKGGLNGLTFLAISRVQTSKELSTRP